MIDIERRGDDGFRLFGFREEPYLDLRAWNAPDTWRFAWDDRIEP